MYSLHNHILSESLYLPLLLPVQDGNVAALQDMLGTTQLADLEELTYGAIPYTPLFLAFMNDHFQVRGRRWGDGEGGEEGREGGRWGKWGGMESNSYL